MKQLSQTQLKRLTAVHGWSGTVLGLLLYVVLVTGTVAVFAHEIADWSVGGHPGRDPYGATIDRNVRAVVDPLTKGYWQSVGVWGGANGELRVFPHAHMQNPETGKIDDYGPMFRIDPDSGQVLSRHEGFAWNEPRWYEASALEDFLIDLHVQLYMPEPWGLIVTGILGLTMMAAGVSGFVMHRHLIRDLFVSTRSGERLVTARDRHVLAASWGLVFAFLLGFTGSFFSFAPTLTFPLLSQVAFGGDQEAMADTLYAPAVTEDKTPAPMADLGRMAAHAIRQTGSEIGYIEITNYGRADSRISIWNHPPERRLAWVHNVYEGSTGKYLGARPIVGREPSAGGFVYDLIYPLHTGDFGGALSKSVWVGLGAAMAFVVVSGLRLWVRRREEERMWRRFGRAVTVTSYGLPAAILASAYGSFLASGAGADVFWWTPAGFVIGAVCAVFPGFAFLGDEERLCRLYRFTLGAGTIALPVVRMATGGLDWASALRFGQGTVLSVDLVLIALGAGLIWWARRPRSIANAEPLPAE